MYKPFWTKTIWPGWQEGPGKVKIWHIWVISMGHVHQCIILTFPDAPSQPSQIFLVQNGLYRCPTYSTTCFMSNSHLWGYFWPSEVRFRGILALSRDWFYNGKKQKCKFLKKPSWPDFQILCGDSWGNFTKNGTNLRPGEFFFGFDPYRQLCLAMFQLNKGNFDNSK